MEKTTFSCFLYLIGLYKPELPMACNTVRFCQAIHHEDFYSADLFGRQIVGGHKSDIGKSGRCDYRGNQNDIENDS